MGDVITALQNTPVPTILVVGGLVFLFLAVVGQFVGQIEVSPERQKWAGLIGFLLLISGVGLYVVPVSPSVPTPTIVAAIALDTSTPMPVVPTDTPSLEPPTNTPVPEPTDTPISMPTSTNTSTPTPAPTRKPTPTRTPTPTPTSLMRGELLFEDTFDDNRYGWDLYPPEVWIEEGSLHASPNQDDETWIFGAPLNFNDFIYETMVTIVDEPDKFDWVALRFRVSPDGKQSYSCGIHRAGDSMGYSFQTVDRTFTPERWNNLVWTDRSLIDPGRTTHKIIIVARGDELQLWVDDTLIHTLSDGTYSSGTLGLGFGANVHVAFDYVRVWALP
jgi:hypothetical protein